MFKILNGELTTVLLIVASCLFLILKNYHIYTTSINADTYASLYGRSQYVIGGSSDKIDDSTLYAYAAIAYARGEDPTTINFEHPPFGKYLYSIGYVLFNNPYVVNIFIYPSLLLLFYLLSKYFITKTWLKNIALLLFGSLQLIVSHTQYALLELPFLLGNFLLFLLLFRRQKKWSTYVLMGVVFGLTSSIKYPIPLMGVFAIVFLFWGFRDKDLKRYILVFLIAGLTFISTYCVYFFHGHSLVDYMLFEKYRFSWFISKTVAQKFLIFSTLFTGRFKDTWTNGYEVANTWSIVWPVSFIMTLLTWRNSLWSREATSLFFVSFSFLAFFSFGAAASDRFFIQLVPYWMLLAAHGVEQYYLQTLKSTKKRR